MRTGRLLASRHGLERLTLSLLVAIVLGAVALLRRLERVEVGGDSMRPTLHPGERLLVMRGLRPRLGDVVVVDDRRVAGRRMVKRVAALGPGGITVLGDNPAASTDSRDLGPLPAVAGRVVYRYHPRHRAGRLPAADMARGGRGYDPAVAGPPQDLDAVLVATSVADLSGLAMDEVRARRAACEEAEVTLSYLRRLVQGRLDIVRTYHQDRLEGGAQSERSLVDRLPEMLAQGVVGGGPGRLARRLEPDVNHRALTEELDRIIDVAGLATLDDRPDAEVAAVVDALTDLEGRVSARRRALHGPLDALQAEIVRRYRSGEATVDSLL
ncbi:MAG: S26 family signal peptidase [Acidimicrobiales bacterium]